MTFLRNKNASLLRASQNSVRGCSKSDVRLGATKKSISNIMEMGEGTIIELDRLTGEPADFRVNGVTIARGDVIVIDENFGIRLTDIL